MTNTSAKQLIAKAKACQAQAVEIPGNPTYHMIRVGLGKKAETRETHVNILQETIDYLTCKAKGRIAF